MLSSSSPVPPYTPTVCHTRSAPLSPEPLSSLQLPGLSARRSCKGAAKPSFGAPHRTTSNIHTASMSSMASQTSGRHHKMFSDPTTPGITWSNLVCSVPDSVDATIQGDRASPDVIMLPHAPTSTPWQSPSPPGSPMRHRRSPRSASRFRAIPVNQSPRPASRMSSRPVSPSITTPRPTSAICPRGPSSSLVGAQASVGDLSASLNGSCELTSHRDVAAHTHRGSWYWHVNDSATGHLRIAMQNRRGFGTAPPKPSQERRIGDLCKAGLITADSEQSLPSKTFPQQNAFERGDSQSRGAGKATTYQGGSQTGSPSEPLAVSTPRAALPTPLRSNGLASPSSPSRLSWADAADDGFTEMAEVLRRRSTIANQLKLIFERASNADCMNMAHAGKLRWVNRYATAYRDGAFSNSFYILLEGLVMIQGRGENRQIRPNDPPAIFGLTDACIVVSRTESAIAMRPSLLCCFTLSSTFPSGPRQSALAIVHQTFLDFVLGRLETCPLFDASEFDYGRREEQLRGLAELLRPNIFMSSGIRLLERGSVSESCFLVAAGEVKVTMETGETEILRASASISPFVGEELLLRRAPSSTTVVISSSPTLVLELAERHFSKLSWLRERARRRKSESDGNAHGRRRTSFWRDEGERARTPTPFD